MWILASSQSTNAPSIQIFSTLSSGMNSPSESVGDVVAYLGRGAGDIDRLLARLGDAGGGVGLAQELQHHGRRPDGGQRIGPTGAGDVGRRAMDGLEQRRPRAGRVEVGGSGQADATCNRSAQVGEDVAEEVVGDDHVGTG